MNQPNSPRHLKIHRPEGIAVDIYVNEASWPFKTKIILFWNPSGGPGNVLPELGRGERITLEVDRGDGVLVAWRIIEAVKAIDYKKRCQCADYGVDHTNAEQHRAWLLNQPIPEGGSDEVDGAPSRGDRPARKRKDPVRTSRKR